MTDAGRLLRCPFCGGRNLRRELWHLSAGDEEAIECADCSGSAPLAVWNSRPPWTSWIDGSIPPSPGQRTLHYYRGENGEPAGPVIGTPVHANGSHTIDGHSIYSPLVRWMPLPEWSGAQGEE